MRINKTAPLLMMIGLLGMAFQGANAASCGGTPPTYDLTVAGNSCVINGATFTQVAPQSTGTGVIDSINRIQHTGTEQGYNTTANVFNNLGGNTYNHAVTVGQVGFIDLGSNNVVMRFLLDINQQNSITQGHNNALLNLDEVQLFVSTVSNPNVTTFSSGVLDVPSSKLAYRMDAGTDNTVVLNYALNPGSGAGDMTLDVAQSAITNALDALYGGSSTTAQRNSAYVYIYSAFGSDPNTANDGFEEWAHFSGNPYGEQPCVPTPQNNFCKPQEIPEPGALALVGLALGIAGGVSRRRAPV